MGVAPSMLVATANSSGCTFRYNLDVWLEATLLTKIYRIGPSRHILAKGYILVGKDAARAVQDISAGVTGLQLRWELKAPTAVWICTGPSHVHTAAARDRLFSKLADAQRQLADAARRRGILVLPNAVRSEPEPWRRFLCADIHGVETADPIEGVLFSNLLRTQAPLLIAASGRAGVEASGVEKVHSRMVLDGSYFPCRPWISIAPNHLERVEKYIRSIEGIPRLEALEVNPRGRTSQKAVDSALTDGQFLLASVRASVVLYQALFMRARRLAREGRSTQMLDQNVFERNRSRAATDGPRASLEPGRRIASLQVMQLIEDLHSEFQSLEVRYDELAPLVLGATLRRLGYAGLQNENDLFRTFHREAVQRRSDLIGSIAERLAHHASEDLLTTYNRQRYPIVENEIAEWWSAWLTVSDAAPQPRPALEQHRERQPAQARVRSDATRRFSPSDSGRARPSPASVLLAALRHVGPNCTNEDRIRVLLEFRTVANPELLGVQVSRLPVDDRRELGRLLLPKSARMRTIGPSNAFWNDPILGQVLQFARNTGIGLLAIEAKEEEVQHLRLWLDELRGKTPVGLEMYLWKLLRVNGIVRQEVLLVRCSAQEGK